MCVCVGVCRYMYMCGCEALITCKTKSLFLLFLP